MPELPLQELARGHSDSKIRAATPCTIRQKSGGEQERLCRDCRRSLPDAAPHLKWLRETGILAGIAGNQPVETEDALYSLEVFAGI